MQYRFPKELAEFPSREFYQNKLQTGIQDSAQVLSVLTMSTFPWPRKAGVVVPTVFIQCSSEEDMGGVSKSNEGQAEMVKGIIAMLIQKAEATNDHSEPLKITVLSPYSKQVQVLRGVLSPSVPCFTIDSFQGRESDIIIFSTVRCNAAAEIGFVEDERRLNVMWTRAKLALIIVGDRRTMAGKSGVWQRAIEFCTEATLDLADIVAK